ncbi:CBS domain-containing protein [Methanofollis fontis]|uniref:CBS domain-containing protein n=1 Tax=Methanofollis fontis TaxID=2052832 RepID=A0A483CSP1_9EURY|nr:CBS domain-containing protein [Methanofollis fontis]TAJ44115.1 CBS domain-containing protein [Methanofollis fontis]
MLVSDYMTKDVVGVEIPSNRDDILKILKHTGISGVPVTEKGRVVGVVTRKDLLRKSEETQVALLMSQKPIVISPDASLVEAAAIMTGHSFRRLPVVDDDGILVGLISVADLVAAIAQLRIKDEIRDFYLSTTFALWEETPLPLVGRIMEISDVEAVPIMDERGRISGIISERDLIRNSHIEDSVEVSDFSNGTDDDEWTWESIRDMHVMSYGVSKVQLPEKPVRGAMVSNVITVPKNAGISECALMMKRARLDQLPVVNGDKRLIAMLFDRELIRVLCMEQDQ